MSLSVALVACGPEKEKEYTGAEPSQGTAADAARFAPLVRLAKGETLEPMDATHFIERSALRFDHDGMCRDEGPVADPADPRRLGSAENPYQHADIEPGKASSKPVSCPGHGERWRTSTEPDGGFYLDPPKEVREGEGTGAPVYWEYHKHKTDPARGAYVYWFFYAYNNLLGGNRHEGDWERVAVQLRDGKPEAMTFAKHGGDPCSVKWSDLDPQGGHPTVYSARGSHGSYPTTGYHRVKIALDRTSKGAEWHTWDNIRPVKGEPWWGYAGWWGSQQHVNGFNGPIGPYPKRLLPGIFTSDSCGPADEKPTSPPQDQPTEQPSDQPSERPSERPSDQGAPRTEEGAIRRYEEYLHAVGREDIKTVCDVGGPAAKQAEDQGFGPCESTFLVTFQMISPTQKKALQAATVDPQKIVVRAPDKIDIPAAAVKASVTFSESEIGTSTLEYLKDNWYITD
ncbi:PT domain-containing protein [Streptomyces sparsogenes]|uniref:PT domain-containing protein n=1 Tax=Streptomyces sparsogenes TaxID=67365 RepID=UPI0033D9890E